MVGRAAPSLPFAQPILKSGKPVLVNFFASWCTPCLAEHPLFTRLKEREGATIIGIAWKDKPEATRAWLGRLGDPFAAVGCDQDGKLALDWGLSGVPETYLIDGQGIVRLHFRGPLTERDLGDHPAAAAGGRPSSMRCAALVATLPLGRLLVLLRARRRARRRAVGDAEGPRARGARARDRAGAALRGLPEPGDRRFQRRGGARHAPRRARAASPPATATGR
jgi:cytochrome c biogenesis protein CcmG/thiol:disulfide interchange protein DsbE